jgi:DNA-binding XRE family transcriptional regulator
VLRREIDDGGEEESDAVEDAAGWVDMTEMIAMLMVRLDAVLLALDSVSLKQTLTGRRVMSAVDHRAVAAAFAAILRTARVGAGLSQEKLAEAADIDRTYPSLLERGLRQPTLAVLIEKLGKLSHPYRPLKLSSRSTPDIRQKPSRRRR